MLNTMKFLIEEKTNVPPRQGEQSDEAIQNLINQYENYQNKPSSIPDDYFPGY